MLYAIKYEGRCNWKKEIMSIAIIAVIIELTKIYQTVKESQIWIAIFP